MENKIYNDDVERIVNDPERVEAINEFHRKRHAKRQRKMLMDAIVFATVAVAFAAVGICGLMTNWIACPVFCACGIWSAFCLGRFFENGKIYGWY